MDNSRASARRPWRWLRIASLILLAVAALAALRFTRAGQLRSHARPELSELVAAVGATRPVEGRLTGGFHYGAPAAASVRSGTASLDTLPPETRIASAKLEQVAANRRSPRSLAALGVALLVTGRVQDAVAALESAVRDDPGHYAAWSDLSSAYMVRSEQGRRPEDLARALDAAERATRGAPDLVEAWFNRALAIEQIGGLRAEARKAWGEYLRIDSRSAWGVEAKKHLDAVATTAEAPWTQARSGLIQAIENHDRQRVSATARKFPVKVRDHLFVEVLPSWAAAVLASRADDATVAMTRARLVAGAIVDATSDSMATDVVKGIDSVAGRTQGLTTLANGVQSFGAAKRLADQAQIDASVALFQSAAATLEPTGNPLFAEALINRATGFVRSRRYDEATPLVQRLIAFGESRHYPLLVARARWAAGLIAVTHSDFAGALVEYRAAIAAFESSGEREDAIRIHSLIAENLRALGQLRESWAEQRQALLLIDQVADLGGREVILGSAANACIRGEAPYAASVFFDAMVDEAEQSGRPFQIVGAYLRRARSSWRIGASDEAARDLEAAREGLKGITDRSLARTQEIEVLAQEGEVFQQRQPDRAIRALDEAVAHLGDVGSTRRLLGLLLTRGRAQLARGTIDVAELDFLRGIEQFEKAHSRIGPEDLRASHFDEAWDLFSEMINLQAVRQRPDQALAFAERARARTLREAVEGASAAEPPVELFDEGVRSRLAGTSVVCYLALPDRLLTWVLSESRADFRELRIHRNELARLVEEYQANISRRAADRIIESDATRLYDAIVKPLAASLETAQNVIFVPDGPLHAVAFAALKNPQSRRYVVQDHSVGIAPSLTLLLQSMQRTQSASSVLGDALVVGDPAFDRSVLGNLPDLAEARGEAIDVAGLYPHANLLIGAEATKARFLSDLNNHDVVHFAGHALQNPEFPWLSRLLLAGTGGSGTVFAYELASRRLDRVRLVVLGACGTAAGPTLRGEGVLNLARPFLAAGVPTVIATLWDVDDRAGRTLLSAFHRNVRAGESAVDALRHAQLNLIGSADPVLQHPNAWAPFISIGAPGQVIGQHKTRTSLD